ncbi:MAG: hypothetical protein J0H35_07985, partial [Rhodospirillales bacterium]|nr:hypothetical protein [Rhodospirillales bacterium]
MSSESNNDVGRAMAALGGSAISYRNFAASPAGAVDPERAAARAAAFPLLAAALPEMGEITALPPPPPAPTRMPDPPQAVETRAPEPVERAAARAVEPTRDHAPARPRERAPDYGRPPEYAQEWSAPGAAPPGGAPAVHAAPGYAPAGYGPAAHPQAA